MKNKTFTEDEVVKAYQAVYRRCIRAIEKNCESDKEREIRSEQVFVTLAALRRELGIAL